MNRSSTSLHDGALPFPSHVSSALSACAASGPELPSLLWCSSHSRKDAACHLTPCACISSRSHVLAKSPTYSTLAILSCHTQLSLCSPSHSQRYSHPCPSSSVPPPVAGRRLPCCLHLQHPVGRPPSRLLSVCALLCYRPLPLPSQLRPLWSLQVAPPASCSKLCSAVFTHLSTPPG